MHRNKLPRTKIVLEIPAALFKTFKASVPSGQRSAVITRLLERAVAEKCKRDEMVCRRVNRLKRLSAEMAKWEKMENA